MSATDKLKLRYIVGAIAIIVIAILTYSQVIDASLGITTIVGVLTALGLYEGFDRFIRGN